MPPKAARADSQSVPESKLYAECKAVLDGLGASEVSKLRNALNKLLELQLCSLPEGALDVEQTLQLLLKHVSNGDLAVQQGAALALSSLCRAPDSPPATAFLKQAESFQVLWSVIEGYQKAVVAIRSAPVTPTSTAPVSKTKQAEAVPVIPGPDKLVLESVLRAVASLACSSAEFTDFMFSCDIQPLMTLLNHPAPRVQVVTLRVLHVMARMPAVNRGIALSGAIRHVLPLCTCTVTDVKLGALKLLERLTSSGGIQQVELGAASSMILDTLVNPLGDEVPAAPQPVKGKVVETQGPSPATLEEIQLQCLALVQNVCRHSSATRCQLGRDGALQVLTAFLPEPPPTASTACIPDEELNAPAVASKSTNDTIFSALIGSRPGSTGSQAATTAMISREAAHSSNLQGVPQQPAVYKLPQTKSASHRMTSAVLSAMASVAGGDEGLAAAAQQLPKLFATLTYMLQKPVVPPTPVVEDDVVNEIVDSKQTIKGKPNSDSKPKGREEMKLKGRDDKKAASRKVVQDISPQVTSEHLAPPFPNHVHAAVLSCLSSLCASSQFCDGYTTEPFLQQLPLLLDLEDEQVASAAAMFGINLLHRCDASQAAYVHAAAVNLLQQLSQRSSKSTQLLSASLAQMSVKLGEAALTAPARPPLPSPPSTPPPAPLATTVFLWDALNRPLITDGVLLDAQG